MWMHDVKDVDQWGIWERSCVRISEAHLSRGLWARLWTRAQEWLLRGWSSTATFKGKRTGFWSSSSLTPETENKRKKTLWSLLHHLYDSDGGLNLHHRPFHNQSHSLKPWKPWKTTPPTPWRAATAHSSTALVHLNTQSAPFRQRSLLTPIQSV